MTERRKVPMKRMTDMRNTSGMYLGAKQPGPSKVPFNDMHWALSRLVQLDAFHSVIVLFVGRHEQLFGNKNASKSPDGFIGLSAPIFKTFSIA